MKTALQVILIAFMSLYLFASLNQRKSENQYFFMIAAMILAVIEAVSIAVL